MEAFKQQFLSLGEQNDPAAMRTTLASAYSNLEAKFGEAFRPPRPVPSAADYHGPVGEEPGAGEEQAPPPVHVMHVDEEEFGEVVGSVEGISDTAKRELLEAFRSQAKKPRHGSPGPRASCAPNQPGGLEWDLM